MAQSRASSKYDSCK